MLEFLAHFFAIFLVFDTRNGLPVIHQDTGPLTRVYTSAYCMYISFMLEFLAHFFAIFLVFDKRNGLPAASLGDKSYQVPEYSLDFHKQGSTRPVINFG